MVPAPPHTDAGRAAGGRLRLAAALGGAGLLAIGMGAGVLQAEAEDAATAAPGADALAGHAPAPTTTPAASSATSSTAATAPAATTSSTPVAQEPSAPEAAPAAVPAGEPADEPAATPAAVEPAAQPPADAAPAPAEAAPEQGPEPEPDALECERSDEKALGVQGAEEDAEERPAIRCEPEAEKTPKPKRERGAGKRKPERDPHEHAPRREAAEPPAPIRTAGGAPTMANPTTSVVMPGPAAIGVPNFFIDKFRIPPFLLPIYQAAGMEHGIRWEILAAINEIETDYGRNLNVSSAGALGWMQFMPATWKAYGVDANGDGRKDPYNPVDAIFAAARYLKAAGGMDDLRKAIFAYNHADWYVDSVLMRARLVGGLPADLVGSLTGLTEGRFPIQGRSRYADDLAEQQAARRIPRGRNAAVPVEGDATRRGIDIFAKPGALVVATHDGRIVRRGQDERLGNFVQVRDAHGNVYTYGALRSLTRHHPVPKRGEKPADAALEAVGGADETDSGSADRKERLFANPQRERAFAAGGDEQVEAPVPHDNDEYVRDLLHLTPEQVDWKRLERGSQVVAGTVLGYVGETTPTKDAHLRFEIRPAGRGAPRIDPKPILDGWQLLETTEIYRANRKNPFHGRDARTPTIGQILLMSKEALQRRVLENPRITLHEGGRLDIRSGRIDRRVLALLEYLAANGLEPTVSSLYREGSITVSGNLSHHAIGTAVDISAVNGVPIIGHQGNGSVTDIAIRRLLTLQGAMKPDQIISLMSYPGASNTIAMGDHADHIHVGFRPVGADARTGRAVNAQLKPGQWFRVIDRLNAIENPVVRKSPSAASLKVTPKRRPGQSR